MRSEKVIQLENLWKSIAECKRCMIAKYARNKVFGDGNVSSPIVFLGEAPGMDEDASGHVFIGRAGSTYSRALKAASLTREEVFTLNVLKCHPPEGINPVSGNRKPAVVEIANCLPFLQKQLDIINPKILVCMGETAARAVLDLPKKGPFKQYVGDIYELGNDIMKFWEPKMAVGVTYHPQYLNYNAKNEDLWTDYVRTFRKFKERANGNR